jgi:soluble lytic murein transglycosylase-like protein
MAQYHQRYDGDDAKALAAYNAGPGALEQAIQRCGDRWLWCVSPETRQYVLSH